MEVIRIAIGRKNYLHASSELGAQAAAIACSLINSCLMVAIEPFIYIADVLERISTVTQSNVESLLPRNWNILYKEEATLTYGGNNDLTFEHT